jgi:hypothetical protein
MVMRGTKVSLAATAALLLVGPLVAAPSVSAAGAASTPSTCSSTAVQDTNGDGYSDAAVGSPTATVSGKHQAGVVTLLYGYTSGLIKSGKIEQGQGGVPGTLKANHNFGNTLLFADVNGDGCVDVIIGSSQGRSYPKEATTVLYGSPRAGITSAGAQFAATTSPLAAGDFNGDGYADLVAQVADPNPLSCCQYEVVPGSPSGLDFAAATPLVTPDGLNAGAIAVTGDVNHDGYDDVAVYSIGSTDIQVIYGSATGLGGGIASQDWNRESPGVPGDDVDFPRFPAVFGDFNGDGYDDLAFGEFNGAINTNHITVLYGSASGLTAYGAQDWAKTTSGVPGHRQSDDEVGNLVSAGDFSDSGRDDLVASASAHHTLALPGGSGGLTATGSDLLKLTPGGSYDVGAFGKSAADDLLIATGVRSCTVVYGDASVPTGLKASRAVPLKLAKHDKCELVSTS